MIAIVPVDTATLSVAALARIQGLQDRREEVRRNRRAPRTLESYRNDWRQLVTWAEGFADEIGTAHDLPTDPDLLSEPMAPELLEAYLLDRSDPDGDAVTPQTLARHLSAVRWWHREARLASPSDHPDVRATLEGLGERAPDRQARPLYLEDLRRAVAVLGDDPRGVRDAAVLTLGWWSAMRRSELVALDRSEVEPHPEGLLVTIRRSKTSRKPVTVAVQCNELCPRAVWNLSCRGHGQTTRGGPP